jgi:transcriptional regulator with XRE-family HTH domain
MKNQTLGMRIAQERRMKSVREWRDLGHTEIAEAVGISQPTYSRYEADASKPDDDTLGRLADYFGVTRSWLRFGEGERVALQLKAAPRPAKEAPGDADAGDRARRPGRGGK